MTFTNLDVALDDLPRAAKVEFHRLHRNHARLSLALTLLLELPIVLAGLVAFAASAEFRAGVTAGPVFLPASAICAAFIAMPWLIYRSAAVIRYAIREHDIILRSGIFWKKETVQPVTRIQHVEEVQGPVAKRFGLSTLKLYSAGTGSFSFEIPGLDEETAARIKAFILERHGREPEAVDEPGGAAGAVDEPGGAAGAVDEPGGAARAGGGRGSTDRAADDAQGTRRGRRS